MGGLEAVIDGGLFASACRWTGPGLRTQRLGGRESRHVVPGEGISRPSVQGFER